MRPKNLKKLLENKYVRVISMRAIMDKNRDNGGYFFTESATGFFNSHYSDHVFALNAAETSKPKKRINYGYFITSEKIPGCGSKRNHTIRRVNLNTGRAIHTVGEFNQIPTINEAYGELLEMILNERLPVVK